ncbi:hypothetical protein [uncultured Enterovirga sp.]|uniref:hypothetical protein n=1 Tax=uncultured Enterovirga sp. TaxID=2026352 RepID=UPI0035C9B546
MTCRDPRLHIEAELAKLEALPNELAQRHLGWRLIEAFVARNPGELLFWSVAFARYEGAGAAEIIDEVVSTAVPGPERSN